MEAHAKNFVSSGLATPRNSFSAGCEAPDEHAIQPALIRVDVPISEVIRKPSLGRAIEYCAELAGYSYDKELEHALANAGVKVDATQLTRWKQGGEGIKWDKFCGLMDVCGNDAPLLWMLHARGYDVACLRKRESETERELRIARERIRQLESEREIELSLIRSLRLT